MLLIKQLWIYVCISLDGYMLSFFFANI
jgi:hypothetical protein